MECLVKVSNTNNDWVVNFVKNYVEIKTW